MGTDDGPRPALVLVRLLGPIAVVLGGAEVEVPSRRQRALLAALAIRGRAVSVDELVDAVWGDDPPVGARATLQTYVSRLRRMLGAGAIVHGPAGYALGPDVVVDVAEARACLRELQRSGIDDDVRRAELALAELERWSGPALEELAGSSWFAGARVELAEMRSNLTEIAADAMTRTGRVPEAISLLDTAIADDPWREPTRILLVRALHVAGRTTDAVRSAAAYRRELGEETGLLPGRAFEDVESEIFAGGPAETLDDERASTTASSSTSLGRPTPLVGRVRDLDRLREAVSSTRLVTLTGPGGIGKTRLVAEFLADGAVDTSAPAGPLPSVVVELAPVVADAAAAVGSAIGVRAERADSGVVAERLQGEHLLLVLDNAEHLLADTRRLCRAVLDRCVDIRIVVTSRSRLDLSDEVVLALDPLPSVGADSEAVALFIDRVRRVRPHDRLDGDDPGVQSLCRRLDGVPLALELAASRAAVLGVTGLHQLLATSPAVLVETDESRGRHDTLGNVVAWSMDLVGASDRWLLASLSVFQGIFDLDAATAVGRCVIDDSVPIVLGRLVDASLVSIGPEPGRYRLLEMVRAFAAEQLTRIGHEREVRSAHADWLRRRLEDVADRLPGGDESAIDDEIDRLRHEIRASVHWSADHGDPSAAVGVVDALAGPMLYRPDADLLEEIWWVSRLPSIGSTPFEGAALAAGARAAFLLGDLDDVDELARRCQAVGPADGRSRLRAQHAVGVVRLYQGRFEESQWWFDRVVGDAESTVVDRLDALGGTALARCYLGDHDGACRAIDRLQGMLTATPSPTYQAFADYVRAEIRLATGDVEQAAQLLSDAAERAWGVGATFVWGVASTVLAGVLVHHRQPAEVRDHLPTLVARWRRTSTWPQLWTTLRLVAEHLAVTGEPAVARLIIEAADHDPAAPTLAGEDAARIAALRERLGTGLGPAADGAASAATVIDRITVLDRAQAALAMPIPT